MIINGHTLFAAAPIKNMTPVKLSAHGTSYGLGEAGYDICIKQQVSFRKFLWLFPQVKVGATGKWKFGRFCLASAIEEFKMNDWLTGIVHDKSTWARQGLSVFNTVIEPGWNGYLTLELVYHGQGKLIIPAGSGIAQVIFHEVKEQRPYTGKYANQPDRPVGAIESV